jgi:stalled ribosome rescue protein Dom34
MKTEAGVWIDHRKAVVVTITGAGEEMREITSNLEKDVRYRGASKDSPEDQRDRRFTGHLNKYYDEVVACLRDVDSILIFGPGEAKTELEVRLEQEAIHGHVVRSETADKMTERQIGARVRRQFGRARQGTRVRGAQ